MVTMEQGNVPAFFKELTKFDPVSEKKYRIMFQRAILEEREQSLSMGRRQGRSEGRQEVIKRMQGIVSPEVISEIVKKLN